LHEVSPVTGPAGGSDGEIAYTPSGGVDDGAFNAAKPPPVSAQDIQFGEGTCRAGDLGCIKVRKF
jgi:hypothetical protein